MDTSGQDVLGALWNVLKVAGGFFAVIGIWLGIQAFARRRSGCARDRDMLDYMLHGCGGCARGGKCSKSEEKARVVTDGEREHYESL